MKKERKVGWTCKTCKEVVTIAMVESDTWEKGKGAIAQCMPCYRKEKYGKEVVESELPVLQGAS